MPGHPSQTNNDMPPMPPMPPMPSEGPVEGFTNLSEMGINVDLVLKSIFYGAIFYLLSLPEVYKMTSSCVGKRVDGVLLHGIVFAVLYYVLTHFI